MPPTQLEDHELPKPLCGSNKPSRARLPLWSPHLSSRAHAQAAPEAPSAGPIACHAVLGEHSGPPKHRSGCLQPLPALPWVVGILSEPRPQGRVPERAFQVGIPGGFFHRERVPHVSNPAVVCPRSHGAPIPALFPSLYCPHLHDVPIVSPPPWYFHPHGIPIPQTPGVSTPMVFPSPWCSRSH